MPSRPQGEEALVLLRPPQGFVCQAGDPVRVDADGIARVSRETATSLLRRNEGWRVVREPIPAGELDRLRERLAFLERRAHELGEELRAAGEDEGRRVVERESLRADLIEGRVTADEVLEAGATLERGRMKRQEIGAAIDTLKREHEQLSLRLAAEERLRRALDDQP